MTIEQDVQKMREHMERLTELAIARYSGAYDQYGSFEDYPPEKFLRMLGTNLVTLTIAEQGYDVIEIADQAADCINGVLLSFMSWMHEKEK